jgi:hypothetical protein
VSSDYCDDCERKVVLTFYHETGPYIFVRWRVGVHASVSRRSSERREEHVAATTNRLFREL